MNKQAYLIFKNIFFSKVIFGLFLLFFNAIEAQTKKYVEHTILPNETLSSIAVKYEVSSSAIIALNPEAAKGIKSNKILLIPVQKSTDKKKELAAKSKPTTHVVTAKETKFSVSKLYSISIADLEKLNPFLVSDGMQIGQILQLVTSKNKAIVAVDKSSKQSVVPIYHIIEQQETKYSVSKKYGLTIEQLEQQNPEIANNFPIGQKLVILANAKSGASSVEKSVEKPLPVQEPKMGTKKSAVANDKAFEYTDYIIKKGETVYSLSRLFNWSEEKLVAINPSLKNGVIEGMIIKGAQNSTVNAAQLKSKYNDLSKTTTNNSKKELVLFLPFNVTKIENDTVNSVTERLKKDKFLNLTLDFYSGALMAIDSAKVLNLNLNVRIYDSEETKNSSSAVQIISNTNFQNTDVVIGPFYQTNVEKVAESLADKSVFVISPLSKENGKSIKNLIQSTPTADATKNVIFDYMNAKNGNIIAVIDPKKASIKQYLDQNQKGIKFVNPNEKGGFVSDSIKKHFVKNKINYVVMESERTGVIFTTTTTLLNALKEYQVQLVILEPNETLDFEEIALSRLTKLKMMYPSVTFENDTEQANQFEKSYKKKNKMYPNQYAVRGFDLVFDTMLRLAQAGTFEQTLNQNATQQIENKFDYTAKPGGGFANNGISILYYDTDLVIKQAQ